MDLGKLSPMNVTVGMLVGAVFMWWQLKDRMKEEVKEEVTEQVTTASKLARLDERMKAMEERVGKQEGWQTSQTERLNAAFQLINKSQAPAPTTKP